MSYIFVTGASGLLGSEIVRQLSEKNYYIIGQYYKNKPDTIKNSSWIKGDFSNLISIRLFLNSNKDMIKKCSYLINCYGPITYKNIRQLETEDYSNDFFSNLIIPVEIINFFLRSEWQILKSVVNIGFELTGEIKPVKNVLSYSIAKNALLEYTLSIADAYKNINFNMISPLTIEGAEVPSKDGKTVPLNIVARNVIDKLLEK